jgi:hypothetical protein
MPVTMTAVVNPAGNESDECRGSKFASFHTACAILTGRSAQKKKSSKGSTQPLEKVQNGQVNPRKNQAFFFDCLCQALTGFG